MEDVDPTNMDDVDLHIYEWYTWVERFMDDEACRDYLPPTPLFEWLVDHSPVYDDQPPMVCARHKGNGMMPDRPAVGCTPCQQAGQLYADWEQLRDQWNADTRHKQARLKFCDHCPPDGLLRPELNTATWCDHPDEADKVAWLEAETRWLMDGEMAIRGAVWERAKRFDTARYLTVVVAAEHIDTDGWTPPTLPFAINIHAMADYITKEWRTKPSDVASVIEQIDGISDPRLAKNWPSDHLSAAIDAIKKQGEAEEAALDRKREQGCRDCKTGDSPFPGRWILGDDGTPLILVFMDGRMPSHLRPIYEESDGLEFTVQKIAGKGELVYTQVECRHWDEYDDGATYNEFNTEVISRYCSEHGAAPATLGMLSRLTFGDRPALDGRPDARAELIAARVAPIAIEAPVVNAEVVEEPGEYPPSR